MAEDEKQTIIVNREAQQPSSALWLGIVVAVLLVILVLLLYGGMYLFASVKSEMNHLAASYVSNV